MQPYNPYAPPSPANPGSLYRTAESPTAVSLAALEDARQRLNAFLSDPTNVAADARTRGGRIRVVTWVFAGLAAALMLAGVAGLVVEESALSIGAFSVGFLFVIVAVAALVFDLRCPRRDVPGAGPDACVKGYLEALRFGRHGYAVTCLAPTARARVVPAPSFEPAVTGAGSFTLETKKDMKAYAQTFANHGHGQMRLFVTKHVNVISTSGDFAQVEAEITVTSWPRWVSIVGIVIFVLIRFLGIIVYLVLYYTLRKVHTRRVAKWAIRGQDGLYYLYDGDVAGA